MPSGTKTWLEAVAYADEKTAVAVGSQGTLLRSADGGATWERVELNAREWLYGLAFADASRGYVVGERGLILRRTTAARRGRIRRRGSR